MDQSQNTGAKGHRRTRSAAKATRPRSSTKGPLDADDAPLTSPLSPQVQQRIMPSSSGMVPRVGSPAGVRTPGRSSPAPRSAAHSPAAAPRRSMQPASRHKDFSYLLRPEIYHPLTPLNVPPPFRNPSKPPLPETPIPDLIARGQFRAAAAAATLALTTTTDPADYARIFDLLYTRLACLTLIDGGLALAAQEVKALEDLNSDFYFDPETGAHLVPWDLRVLDVRLQMVGFGDARRAVMSYYDLAREARVHLANATASHDNSARELWKSRLAEIGIKVAGALVDMDDLPGAAAHLSSLKDRSTAANGSSSLNMAKALLWLHLGDVDAARQSLHDSAGEVTQKVVSALCDMADGDYPAALTKWGDLREETPEDEMVGVNMAVCLFYVGRMQEGKQILENMVDAGQSSHTLLFNLTTMYELCTERSRTLKLQLAEKVADMKETPSGWEKANADFKL
ncbi:trafficking protein particle complex subunit-like protein [Diplogelasinospora grovesii]|uniref:Trafficking protein particle complex subunit-like protein n=1 Tax=Diplogelasinospora grovesii TaxID=303347 RepID=A0AAN6N1W9_9PEZI|nr:trafficking protein particle complex subunit-like protein [Diplogelasinospora grovesii]